MNKFFLNALLFCSSLSMCSEIQKRTVTVFNARPTLCVELTFLYNQKGCDKLITFSKIMIGPKKRITFDIHSTQYNVKLNIDPIDRKPLKFALADQGNQTIIFRVCSDAATYACYIRKIGDGKKQKEHVVESHCIDIDALALESKKNR